MNSNIKKLYISNFLTGLVFWYSVEKLFMYQIGINAFGVSVNAVVLVIITTLFDVPFGVLADRWNRKYTLALGILALAIGSLVAGSSHSLLMYSLGTAIYGLYLCLTGGTYQAITYDSLKEAGQENLYSKHQGGSYGSFMVAIAVASPIGGYLANAYGYRFTYFLSAAICVINILVILSMREPKFHKTERKIKIRHHIGDATKLILNNKTIAYLASIILVAGMLRASLNEYAGLYFIAIGFGAIGSGWANGGKWLFGAVGQFLASRMARLFPWLIGLFFLAFITMTSLHTPLGLIFFYTCTFCYGVIQNEAQALIQKRVKSDMRATILSLISFGESSLMIPLGLMFGYIAEHDSVFAAYRMFGIIGLVYFVIWLFWRKNIHIEPTNQAPVEGVILT